VIGLYAHIYSPKIQGEKLLNDQFELFNLDCETLAVGGFWAANTQRPMLLPLAEDWFENSLGRVINVFANDGFLVWRGFVNSVSINAGAVTEVRGPLIETRTRMQAVYTPRDFSVYPPVDGSQTTTVVTQDDESVERYGAWDGVISAGTCPDDVALKVRNLALTKMKFPKTTSNLSIAPGNTQEPSVGLELLGNVHWLTAYIYDNLSNGLSFLSDKLKAVLTYDPNNIVSSDYTGIEDNLYLVNDLEDKLRYAWDIVSEMLTIGGGSDDNRRIFGLYEQDRPLYSSIPNAIEYEYDLVTNQVRSVAQGEVLPPWAVRPGKWITIPNLLAGRKIESTGLNGDPRNKFIESVRYSVPYTLDLSGGETDRLSQMLAKITYTGGIY